MNNLKIQTDLRRADFNAFVRLISRRTVQAHRAKRAVIAFVAFVPIAIIVLLILWLSNSHLEPLSFYLGAISIILWYLIISRVRVFRLGPAADGITLGPRTIALEEDGIRQTSERHNSLFLWSAIKSVEVTKQHIFVMLDANAAIIIPLAAFVTFAERDQFVDEVRKRSKGAIAALAK